MLTSRLTVQKLRYKRKKQARLAGKIAKRMEKMEDNQSKERDVRAIIRAQNGSVGFETVIR